MSHLLLLRHGESEWNVQGRWQGWADPPLSARGQEQAVEAARRLRGDGFTAVATSDLQRARQTAQLVARDLGLAEGIYTDAGLREYDLGAWSGHTRAEIVEKWPVELAEFRHGSIDAPPGGESRDAFVDRLLSAVLRVADAFPGRTVLVIGHGGAIGTIERYLGLESSRPRHLAGRWVDVEDRRLSAGPERLVLGEEEARR